MKNLFHFGYSSKMKVFGHTYFISSVIIFHEVLLGVCDPLYDDHLQPWNVVRLAAVAKYDGVEDLFKEKHQNRLKSYKNVENPSEEQSDGVKQLDMWPTSLEIKQAICENIFSSDVFAAMGERPVDPKSVKSDLRREQLDLYSTIFIRTDERKVLGGYRDRYVNPYRMQTITVKKDTEKAYGFSCLVKTAALRDPFKMYHISEEYNVSAASSENKLVHPIIGRFVFGFNEEKKLVVFALAHESVRSLVEGPRPYIEYFYLDKMLSHTASEDSKSDPICKMSGSERLRLVSAIFSMKQFKKKYRLPTSTQMLEGNCEKRSISFEGEGAKKKVGSRVFSEWTLAVTVSPTADGSKQEKYHISRGYVHDKAFLHLENQLGNIIPTWNVYHTGVVDDGKNDKASASKDKNKGDEKKKKEEETTKKKEDEPKTHYYHDYQADQSQITYYPEGVGGSYPNINSYYPPPHYANDDPHEGWSILDFLNPRNRR